MIRSMLFVFCFGLPALIMAQQHDRVLYSTVTQEWDEQTGTWMNEIRRDFQYDSAGQVVEVLLTEWDAETRGWTPPAPSCGGQFGCSYRTAKILNSYDERGNKVVTASFGWDTATGDWIDLSRGEWEYRPDGQPARYEYHQWHSQNFSSAYGDLYVYGYNEDGILVREERSRYDTEGGFWIPGSLYEITFQEAGLKVEVLLSDWNESRGEWVPQRKSDSLYNSTGQVTNSVGYELSEGMDLVPEDSAVILYNDQGLPVEVHEYFSHELTGGEWFNIKSIYRVYSPDGQLEEETEFDCKVWSGECEWSDGLRYRYSDEGLLLQKIMMEYYSGEDAWVEVMLEEWAYDSLQRITTETQSRKYTEQGDWVTTNQKVHVYDGFGNQTMVTTFTTSTLPDTETITKVRELSFWAMPGSVPLIITDPNLLEALIAKGVDTNGDGSVSFLEAEEVTRLDISDRGITDLTGLEAFVQLDTLICRDNGITGNDLLLIPWITFLDCSNCGLTSLDVALFPQLKSLNCSGNGFERMDLTTCPQLHYLDLSGMPGLLEVCVWEQPFPPDGVTVITDGSSRIHFTPECALGFPDPHFYEALIEAGADLNGDSLIHATEAEAVIELDISGHMIDDLSGLEYFTNLKRLDCSSNIIYELDLTDLPELQFLSCGGTGLGALDLGHLSDLQYLDCSNLPSLGTLDLTGNPLLTTLICSKNQLGSLDISGCQALTYLDLAGNPLTRLDLTENRALTTIDISDMPGLREVCVWQLPFPPSGVEVRKEYSFQIAYNTECGLEQDMFENNDTRLEAAPLRDNLMFDELSVSIYDDDWYELVTDDETMINFLTVECYFSNDSGDINMEILDGSGKVMARTDSYTDDESISIPMNPMESYYLHVHLDSGQVNTYSLSWTSRVYSTNSSVNLCLPGQPCQRFELTPALRDTVYVSEPLNISLFSGDTLTRSIPLENYGPETYLFYTSLRCADLQDDHNFALQFDGVDDRLDIQRYPGIDLNREITLEAWVMPDDNGAAVQPIISRTLNGYGYELFRELIGGEWKLGFRADNGELISEENLPTGRWTHVAVTYDSNVIILYINGEKDASVYAPGTISVVNQSVFVGASSPVEAYPRHFTGSIDDIRIWSVARSYFEIKAFFQQGLRGEEAGLAAYYTLDEVYSTVAVDQTGGSRGTITGGALHVSSEATVIRMIRISPLSSSLSNGAALPLIVTADARDLRGGIYHLELHLNSNVEEHPDMVIPIRLQVTDAASISVTTDTLDFGVMELYQTETRTFEVINHGSRDLVLDSLWTSLDGTRILPATCVILPGERHTFKIDGFFRFEGNYSGTLLIPSNDPTNAAISLPVKAQARGISNDVLLKSFDVHIRSGYFKAFGLTFPNPSEELACPMQYSFRYLSMPDLKNDRFLREDSADWLDTDLSGDWIMLPPGGVLFFYVMMDASHLSAGEYYGEMVLEWYTLSRVRGYIPIRLHVESSGIEQRDPDDSGVVLYPNPTKGMVTLVTRETSPFLITVTSLTGQVMEQRESGEPEVQLDLSFLAKGIYLVTLHTFSGSITRRLIIY